MEGPLSNHLNSNMTPEQPIWLSASTVDFAATDLEAPLAAAKSIDCTEASSLYGHAAKACNEQGGRAEERVYAMLGAVCSFYFKPSQSAEPYGPMMIHGSARSAQASDFKGNPTMVLAEQIGRVAHLGVKARVADLVWLLDCKQATAGLSAIAGYYNIVSSIRSEAATLRNDQHDAHFHEVPNFLRRAMQIGKAVGWDKPEVVEARAFVSEP
jgi:hypothetical protein